MVAENDRQKNTPTEGRDGVPPVPIDSQEGDDVVVVDPASMTGLGKNSLVAPPDARDPDDPARAVIEPDAGPTS